MDYGTNYKCPADRRTVHAGLNGFRTMFEHMPEPYFKVLCGLVEPRPQGPFLTTVLGSGCTSTSDQGAAMVAALEDVCAGGGAHLMIDGEPAAEVVHQFGVSLIEDRLRVHGLGGSGPKSKPIAGAGEADWEFLLLLVAAGTARLHARIRAVEFAPPVRPGHDDVAVLVEGVREGPQIEQDVRTPCWNCLQVLLSTDHVRRIADRIVGGEGEAVPTVLDAVSGVLNAAREALTPLEAAGTRLRVPRSTVESLAELAWLTLSAREGEAYYPGWSDLLLDLSAFGGWKHRPRGTPAFNSLVTPDSMVRSRYLRATRASWASRLSEAQHGRFRFYDSVASLLVAHAEQRRDVLPANRGPAPVSFVTSFDLELELALMQHGAEFMVLLPIHMYQEAAGVAWLRWVALRVPASKRLDEDSLEDALLCPDVERWSLLPDKDYDPGVPVVVRLSGCPLISLGGLVDGHGRRDSSIDEALRMEVDELSARAATELHEDVENIVPIGITHAVVLNENDALHHGRADTFLVGGGVGAWGGTSSTTNGMQRSRFGLPSNLVVGTGRCPRVWGLFGVQFQDPAMRHRVSTVVSSLPRLTETPPKLGSTRGFAVNAHSTSLERELLWWNGLEVVEDLVESFIPLLMDHDVQDAGTIAPATKRG